MQDSGATATQAGDDQRLDTSDKCNAGNDESEIEPPLRREFYDHFNIV